MPRGFGNADALPAGRDAGMQVSQRLGIIEPLGLRHKALDQRQHPVGAVDEARQCCAPIGAVPGAALIEPGFGAGGVLGRRQPHQRQKVSALEMRTFFFELRRRSASTRREAASGNRFPGSGWPEGAGPR